MKSPEKMKKIADESQSLRVYLETCTVFLQQLFIKHT